VSEGIPLSDRERAEGFRGDLNDGNWHGHDRERGEGIEPGSKAGRATLLHARQ
jgi:hypothetical protein